MVDHLQSLGTPWRHSAYLVKISGTLSKMDVMVSDDRHSDNNSGSILRLDAFYLFL